MRALLIAQRQHLVSPRLRLRSKRKQARRASARWDTHTPPAIRNALNDRLKLVVIFPVAQAIGHFKFAAQQTGLC
jgi:hypothetical protein